jgi:UDP-N-acetylmuramoyl-tripeptide--D-alanyl-D-alanine ligase
LIDKRVSIPFVIAGAAIALFPTFYVYLAGIAFANIALLAQIIREQNPTKVGIKPLNMTTRVKRIFYTAFVFWCAAVILAPGLFNHIQVIIPFWFAAMALLAPVFIMLGNTIMSPIEKYIVQGRYLREAKAILKKHNPVVIGITGSFGKTSIKNILHHILNSYTASFATKRSINTIMGIVRVIREEMTSPPKFFVAEVGIGDTGQMLPIMKFLDPHYGIVSSIGSPHLENFGTMDIVAREELRTSKAVAKNGGKTILSARHIAPEYIKKHGSPNDIIFTGEEIENIKQTLDGISFTLNYEGNKYKISAPIFGKHQADNIAVSFIMARMMGVSAENIILSLKSLKQTEHRLEVRQEGGFTVIDDSFNSNMAGFISALETGDEIKGKNKFILITPGMVELGDRHAEEHTAVGKVANKLADWVVAVNPDRVRDFTGQIDSKKLIEVVSLGKAREWLAANAKAGDVVLYENDLPDYYQE